MEILLFNNVEKYKKKSKCDKINIINKIIIGVMS